MYFFSFFLLLKFICKFCELPVWSLAPIIQHPKSTRCCILYRTKSFINYTAVSTWKMYNTFKPSQLSLDRSLLIPLCGIKVENSKRKSNKLISHDLIVVSEFNFYWRIFFGRWFQGEIQSHFYELKYCHPLSIDLCMFQWYPRRPTNCTHYVGNCNLYVENVVTRCIIYPRFKICFL